MPDKHAILIVDDEVDVLNALRRVFRNPNYEVLVETNPVAAIETLKEKNIDLIISDMRMPQMTGAEFLAKAKQLKPKTPRILLTGQADMQDTIDAINEGEIMAFVTKPWDNQQFQSLVAEGLQRRQKEKLRNRALHKLKQMHDELNDEVSSKDLVLEEVQAEKGLQGQVLEDTFALMEESFLNLLDMKQPGLRALSHQLEEVVGKLGEKMGEPAEKLLVLHQAARLHGLGKIGLPDAILNKPYDKLDDEQKEVYRSYPANSACTLIAFQHFASCSDILFKQKEKADGSGFPMKLTSADLSPENKIFNAALDYAEYRFHPVQARMTHDQAIAKMREKKAAYDPDVLKALAQLETSRTLLSDRDKVIVVPLHALKPGMIIKEDIYSRSNMLLLRSGARVSDGLIDKLGNLKKLVGGDIMVSVIMPFD